MTTIVRPKPRYMHVNNSISSVECIDYVTYLSSRLGLYPYEVKWLLSGDQIEMLEEYKLRETALIQQPKHEAKYTEDVYMTDISPSNKKMASPAKVTRKPIIQHNINELKQNKCDDYSNNLRMPRTKLVNIIKNRKEYTLPGMHFKNIDCGSKITILTHPDITCGAFAIYEEIEELFIMFDCYLTYLHQFMHDIRNKHFRSFETFISIQEFLTLSVDVLTFHGYAPIKILNLKIRTLVVDNPQMLLDACLIVPNICPLTIISTTHDFLREIFDNPVLLTKIHKFKNLENLSAQIRSLL